MARKTHDEILSRIAELHDRNLLKIVRCGKITVLGGDGKPVQIDLTAAMLNAITNRLKACQVTVANKPGSTMDEIEKELTKGNFKLADHLPPIDESADAATA